MTTTRLDRFGRVVIPKPIRDGLGLEPGMVLVVHEQADGILLKPTEQDAPLAVEDGVLVFTGEALEDIVDVVRKQREERTRRVLGLGGP